MSTPPPEPAADPPHDVRGEYVLTTSALESRRLALQHRLWADAAHAAWKRAGIGPGARALDLGCGPGFATFDLAELVGTHGRVVSVDESRRFLDEVRAGALQRGLAGSVRAVEADVQALGDAVGTGFDAAWARWVLCFVPDPEGVVAGVAHALRPGGRFVVHDYFNYESMCLAPRGPAFARVVSAVARSFRTRGGDPDVASRLPTLFARHGLSVEHLEVHQRLARPGDPMFAWPDTFFRGYVPVLVEGGLLTAEEGNAWLIEWEAHWAQPGHFMSLPPVYEIVGRKE